MTTLNLIDEFFRQERFAMVGVSRNPESFSRKLFRELHTRGYDVIPINPAVTEMDGKRCLARVKEIEPTITTALLMTGRQITDEVLRDCAGAGVNLVWIYGISGERDISPTALSVCQQHGIGVIAGYCPYMFLPKSAFFHRWHGYFAKIIGNYPT